MNWKFWANKPEKPKLIPEAIGRKMVVELKFDPDEVWTLKYIGRPIDGKNNVIEFSLFNPEKVQQAGVNIKDWTSLDDRPELVQYSGYFDTNRKQIEFTKSFSIGNQV